MKLLLDENVPIGLKEDLRRAGHDVEHINQKCKGKKDAEVFNYAVKNKRVIISNDIDFRDFMRKYHYGIIKLDGKLKNPSECIIELLSIYRKQEKNIENVFFEITEKRAYQTVKKYTKKKNRFKQFYKTPLLLSSLEHNKKKISM